MPPGIGYDPCMTHGGCSDAWLEQIWNAKANLTVHYYQVTRTDVGLDRILIKPVGPGWSPSNRRTGSEMLPTRPGNGGQLFLPVILMPVTSPPDDNSGCPCGWFPADGRILDFIPAP